MNRFLRSRTLVSQAAGWLFVATLFCDEANLDDLLSGSVVLHDDPEVSATELGACEGTNYPMCCEQQRSVGASAVRPSVPLSPTIVRITMDQDSPSPPANQTHIGFESLPCHEDSPAGSLDNELPTELLYLQFRSLLI